MLEVRETDEFADWLGALRDLRGKAKILVRIERLGKEILVTCSRWAKA